MKTRKLVTVFAIAITIIANVAQLKAEEGFFEEVVHDEFDRSNSTSCNEGFSGSGTSIAASACPDIEATATVSKGDKLWTCADSFGNSGTYQEEQRGQKCSPFEVTHLNDACYWAAKIAKNNVFGSCGDSSCQVINGNQTQRANCYRSGPIDRKTTTATSCTFTKGDACGCPLSTR